MDTLEQIVSAGEFKSKCLGIMEDIHETGHPVIITERGIPLVRIIPYSETEKPKKRLFGILKNTVTINGNIIEPISKSWEADK